MDKHFQKADGRSGIVVRWVKLLLGTPMSHMRVLVQDLAALLPIPLPANALWEPQEMAGVLGPHHTWDRLGSASQILALA